MSNERPQDTYIRLLYKINEQYSILPIDEDLQDAISHYNSKKSFTKEELKELERVCKNEWKKILSLLCDSVINKIEKSKKSREILLGELRKCRKLKEKVNRNNLKFSDYEKIFDEEFNDLKDKIESEISRDKWVYIRFKWGLFWGGLIGFLVGITAGIVLFKIGLA